MRDIANHSYAPKPLTQALNPFRWACVTPTMLEELCKRIQHFCAMLRAIKEQKKCWVVGSVVWPISNFAQQLPTTCKRVCKGTKHVTFNNVGSCWPTMLRLLARGFRINCEGTFFLEEHHLKKKVSFKQAITRNFASSWVLQAWLCLYRSQSLRWP